MLALEYHVKSLKTDYLLNVDLEESTRKFDDPQEVCNWVFATYGDVFNTQLISEKQVLNLIQRVLIMKRFEKLKKENPTNEQELFEPDPCRSSNDEKFYKSTQNFFTSKLNDDDKETTESIDKDGNDEHTTQETPAGHSLTPMPSYKNPLVNRNVSAKEERSQMYSDDFIKNELNQLNQNNRMNSYLKSGNANVMNIQDNDVPEIDLDSNRQNENNIEHEVNMKSNLAEYFTNKETKINSLDYMDEISVESLHSEREDNI